MSKAVVPVLISTLGGLAFAALFCWATWVYVFDNVDRGMVHMLWGTFTGTGSFGGQ